MYASVLLSNGLLASAGSTLYNISIWNYTAGTLYASLMGHTNTINALIQLDNGFLISGASDSSIKVWNISTWNIITSLKTASPVFTLAQVSSDCIAASLYTSPYAIQIWNITSLRLVKNLTAHTNYVLALVTLPDSKIASGANDGTVLIWNIANGSFINNLTGNVNQIRSLILLQNGLIAAGSYSSGNLIQIWNLTSGALVSSLLGHKKCVSSLIQLSTGLLASGSYDSTVKLWNVSSGKCLNTLNHTGNVNALVETKNGFLISGSANFTLKVWGN